MSTSACSAEWSRTVRERKVRRFSEPINYHTSAKCRISVRACSIAQGPLLLIHNEQLELHQVNCLIGKSLSLWQDGAEAVPEKVGERSSGLRDESRIYFQSASD
jgi:hypothetical protein